MVLPLFALGGAALAGTGILGAWLGSGKKDCSIVAQEKCSKGGISEVWKGEEIDWDCYTRIYNDCTKEREGTVAKLSPKHKDAIIFGGVALLGLGIIGKYNILGGKE